MSTKKRYTKQQLEDILSQLKAQFPVGSVAIHSTATGKKTEVIIKNHNRFNITTDDNPSQWQLPQGVGYGRFYFWFNGEMCVVKK